MSPDGQILMRSYALIDPHTDYPDNLARDTVRAAEHHSGNLYRRAVKSVLLDNLENAGGQGNRSCASKVDLMYLCKRLQFFDTLALYFNRFTRVRGKRRSFRCADVRRPGCRCHRYADVGRPLRSVALAILRRKPAGVVRGSVYATGGVWDENGTRSVYTAHRKAGCDAFGLPIASADPQ